MQGGEDHLQGGLLEFGVEVDGNAATVVFDGDTAPVFVQDDGDRGGMTVHGLVDRVVEDLPDEMVKPGRTDSADVHAGAFADGFEPFEDGDVFCAVVGRHGGRLV